MTEMTRKIPTPRQAYLASNIIISAGSLITISAALWDVTHHILNRPESFFTAPHALLYSGVLAALAGSILAFFSWQRLDHTAKQAWRFPFRLGMIGIFVLVASGPLDFAWHDAFGLDGLLSPPHQLLLTGMFLTAVAPMLVITRYGSRKTGGQGRPRSILILFSFLPVWLCANGYFQSFSLPFSQTAHFDFNPDIWLAASLITVSAPFLIGTVFVLVSRLSGYRFGIMSAFGLALLTINASSMILYNPALAGTVPFYFATMIPIVVADALASAYKRARASMISGAILGSTFYFMSYPLITYTYNEVILDKAISGSVTFQVFFEQMPVVLPIVAIPAVVMGALGALFAARLHRTIMPKDSALLEQLAS